MGYLHLYFRDNFYTDPISLLLAFIGLIFSFKKSERKDDILRLYFAAYIVLKLSTYTTYFAYYTKSSYYPIINVINFQVDYLFTVLEFFCFTNYLKQFVNKYQNLVSNLIFYTTVLTLFVYIRFVSGHLQFRFLFLVFLLQSLLILGYCISYYIRLFQSNISFDLLNDRAFYVVTGLSFFHLGCLPFSIISAYLFKYDMETFKQLYFIVYVLYSILFSTIIKAMLLKGRYELNPR